MTMSRPSALVLHRILPLIERVGSVEQPLFSRMQARPSAPIIVRWKSKTAGPAVHLLPGKARDDEINLQLRQGHSFFDLASSLERTPAFIAREAKRILGGDELKRLMKRKKKGIWSDDEVRYLISLRQEGLSLPKIMIPLRRTKLCVEKQLREIGITTFKHTALEGPQELPSGFCNSLFDARLVEIWQGLLDSEMTDNWREALRERSAEEWLSIISASIPANVKNILGALCPPTWEDLNRLPSINTDDAGVYARLVSSRFEVQTVMDRYLYVGSASRYNGGLNRRIAEHTMKRRPASRLQRDIRKKGLSKDDRFVALMATKMSSSAKKDVLDIRLTVTLAEAILTVWLGALQSPPPHLSHISLEDRPFYAEAGESRKTDILTFEAKKRS